MTTAGTTWIYTLITTTIWVPDAVKTRSVCPLRRFVAPSLRRLHKTPRSTID